MAQLNPLAYFSWQQQGPQLAQALAAVALVAGLGAWAAIILAPKPHTMPPVLAANMATLPDASSVAGWFGGGNTRIRVTVNGLIASSDQGAALLSINGGKPLAFRVGDTLAPGVVLSRVTDTGIEIEQAGATETLAAPSHAIPLIQGFVPVP